MKPILAYYGGKQRMAQTIVDMIPKHTTYVEPFAGGAAVLFRKPEVASSRYKEVISDMCEHLVNFYRIAKLKPELLKKLIDATPYARSEYLRACNVLKNPSENSDVVRAWAYWFAIISSFSGVFGAGFRSTGINAASQISRKKCELGEKLKRLETVTIESGDFEYVIKRYDSPTTFFYVDPPYVGATQGYRHKFSQNDLERLCDLLDNCKGSFILSGYEGNCTKPFKFKVLNTETLMINRGEPNAERVEYLWYRAAKPGPLKPYIQKLYDSGKLDCFTGNLDD